MLAFVTRQARGAVVRPVDMRKLAGQPRIVANPRLGESVAHDQANLAGLGVVVDDEHSKSLVPIALYAYHDLTVKETLARVDKPHSVPI